MLRSRSITRLTRCRRSTPRIPWSRNLTSTGIIEEGDMVLLDRRTTSATKTTKSDPILSRVLFHGGETRLLEKKEGVVYSDDIIGLQNRTNVRNSTKKIMYRIKVPTLGEYTTLSPRLVTPIYPQDANLIVSLLDLHPSPPSLLNQAKATLSPEKAKIVEELLEPSEGETEDPLEIFEAGTGHGSLTLHLARAIHAANAPAPKIPDFQPQKPVDLKPSNRPPKPTLTLVGISVDFCPKDASIDNAERVAYRNYLSHRRAIIQTLDQSAKYSNFAQRTVRNFRHGMYFPDINFHVGSIPEYLTSRLEENNNKPFLGHAILDLPDTHKYLDIVGKATKANGTLITWNPNISQVIVLAKEVREQSIPWFLEKVLEAGSAAGVGGKQWDIRHVKPRAFKHPVDVTSEAEDGSSHGLSDTVSLDEDAGWEMVCRPKHGLRIDVGGFIGVWRKQTVF